MLQSFSNVEFNQGFWFNWATNSPNSSPIIEFFLFSQCWPWPFNLSYHTGLVENYRSTNQSSYDNVTYCSELIMLFSCSRNSSLDLFLHNKVQLLNSMVHTYFNYITLIYLWRDCMNISLFWIDLKFNKSFMSHFPLKRKGVEAARSRTHTTNKHNNHVTIHNTTQYTQMYLVAMSH